MSKPSLATIRRHLAHTMTAHGYHLGNKALHRDCDDGVRFSLTIDSVPCGFSIPTRGIRLTLSVYRVQDHEAYLDHYGGDPEFDTPGLAFTLWEQFGELLPRPHHHLWLVEDKEDLTRFCAQAEEVYLTHVLPCAEAYLRLLLTLDTSAHLPGGALDGLDLTNRVRTPDERRRRRAQELGKRDPCPYRPCGELGRPASGGGLWPKEFVRDRLC